MEPQFSQATLPLDGLEPIQIAVSPPEAAQLVEDLGEAYNAACSLLRGFITISSLVARSQGSANIQSLAALALSARDFLAVNDG